MTAGGRGIAGGGGHGLDPRAFTRGVPLWASLLGSLALLVAFDKWLNMQFLPEFAPDNPGESLGMMWQVHAAFLGIGFAGLALASQVYSEPPIAPAAARRSLLEHLGLSQIVVHGLAASALMASATFWVPSDAAVVLMFVGFAVPSVLLVADGYHRLGNLYMSPIQVDGLIAEGLEDHAQQIVARLIDQQHDREVRLTQITSARILTKAPDESADRLDFRVGRSRGAVKDINKEVLAESLAIVDKAAAANVLANSTESSEPTAIGEKGLASCLVIRALPHSVLQAHAVTFTLFGAGVNQLDAGVRSLLGRTLATAVIYQDPGWTDPLTELDRELGGIQDAACEALLGGSLHRGQRALELMDGLTGQIWSQSGPAVAEEVGDVRAWLFRPFATVERTTGGDPRAADVLISSATRRTLAAVRADDLNRFVLSLASYLRIWESLLKSAGPGVDDALERILVAMQNVAEYGLRGSSVVVDGFRREVAWAFVALARAALDSGHHESARRAANYHRRLFQYSREAAPSRLDVLVGRLVLSAWMLRMRDRGKAVDREMLLEVTSSEARSSVLGALDASGRRNVQIANWHWWESDEALPLESSISRIAEYVDRAAALMYIRGSGRPAAPSTQQQADDLDRLIERIERINDGELVWLGLADSAGGLTEVLKGLRDAWSQQQAEELAGTELSRTRIDVFRSAFAKAMVGPTRLADFFPRAKPGEVEPQLKNVGFNFLIAKHFFVDAIFDSTYADPEHVGGDLGRVALAAEERFVIDELRGLASLSQGDLGKFADRLEELTSGRQSGRVIVLLSFAAEVDDRWWQMQTTVSNSSARLVNVDLGEERGSEAIVVDLDSSIRVHRYPELEGTLLLAGESGFGVGVYPYQGQEVEPVARVEIGEWIGTLPVEEPLVEVWHVS